MKKIWDAFLFFNEERLLDIRLHELAPIVEGFILVESSTTHQGKPKPLYFKPERYRGFNILYVVVDLPNKGENLSRVAAARNEITQRNAINSMIHDKRDDIVIISDLDEIPMRESVERIAVRGQLPVKLGCLCRYYYLNMEGPKFFSGYGPVAALGREVLRATPQMLRACIYSLMPSMEKAAWHFNFLGNIQAKVDAVCHHDEGHDKVYQSVIDGTISPLEVVAGPLPYLVREEPQLFQDWLASGS